MADTRITIVVYGFQADQKRLTEELETFLHVGREWSGQDVRVGFLIAPPDRDD